MREKEVTVRLKEGLQARPAALFVQNASHFHSHLTMEKDGNVVNVKSIMGVMSLAPTAGERVTLRAEGADEDEAIDALATFIESGE